MSNFQSRALQNDFENGFYIIIGGKTHLEISDTGIKIWRWFITFSPFQAEKLSF